MGRVRARTTMNTRALSQITDAQVEALEKTLAGTRASILSDIMVAEVVPKATGELERSAHVTQEKRGQVTLVYDTPYARRLYWHPEYNFRRDLNRDAQGMWLEGWAQGKENIIKKVFKTIWKKLSGGFIR